MKLYYLKGACSLASLISLIEAGQKFEPVEVERGTKKTADGLDYNAVNPKGYVPALVLDDGNVLTENVCVLSYIATLDPAGKLAPTVGTLGFFRVVEWLAFVNGEIHKQLSVLFRPATTDDVKRSARDNALRRYGFVEESLGDKPYLTGENFRSTSPATRGSPHTWSAAARGLQCSRRAGPRGWRPRSQSVRGATRGYCAGSYRWPTAHRPPARAGLR
jgi:glutathione S-transferase